MADLPTYLQTEIAIAAHMDMISSVKWFKEASPEFLGALMTHLKPMVILPGTYIIRAGEVGSEMYFISRGDVSIVVKKETEWEEVAKLQYAFCLYFSITNISPPFFLCQSSLFLSFQPVVWVSCDDDDFVVYGNTY